MQSAFRGRAELIRSTWGYHPDVDDLAGLINEVAVDELLADGGVVAEHRAAVRAMRCTGEGLELPTGLYWFSRDDQLQVMVVRNGAAPAEHLSVSDDEAADDPALSAAAGWLAHLWDGAAVVPRPRFAVHDDVVVSRTGKDYPVRSLRFAVDQWTYDLRIDGRTKNLPESALEELGTTDDPAEWVQHPPESARRLGATLTRAKLTRVFTDTVFSFRSTKTIFRGYQFKPVIKMLETSKRRVLIADEVGLGKTIEAGLVWTELEARRDADRVLVVCPAALSSKWQREMQERFGFTLAELSGTALKDFTQQVRENRLPPRFSHVMTLEKFRTWELLEDVASLAGPLNLAIVDEAHAMRNRTTENFRAGTVLSEWADALVMLTATPVNLHNTDLFNLLEVLSPGEIADNTSLELQLAPNEVLHRLARLVSDPLSLPGKRTAVLEELRQHLLGLPLLQRPEVALLRELISREGMTARERVRALRHLSDLDALSSLIVRTRRVEVDEEKPVRAPHDVEVVWSDVEQTFYDEYVRWCKDRADAAGTPMGFSMQMPLRLVSACIPAARDQVLRWRDTDDPIDEDRVQVVSPMTQPPAVRPHLELIAAARSLGDVDSKFDRFAERLAAHLAQGQQALVFSFSRPTLAHLSGRLADKGWRVGVLHGGVTREERQQVMADFRAGGYDVVLGNKVASEGLDFEFCSLVVNYDLPWNPMEVEQRIGRIDRIGQKSPRINILNIWCTAALDDVMKRRLLARIKIFERSIGPAEPILAERLSDFERIVFDLSLTDEERERKLEDVLAAVEAQQQGLEDLAGAQAMLLTAAQTDVAGMEAELLSSGRYVGAQELVPILEDWAAARDATQVRTARDGRTVTVTGNREMAEDLSRLVRGGRLSRHEAEGARTQLLIEHPVVIALDHEWARTSAGLDLLSARHPLVLAAASLPEQHEARFGRLALAAAPDVVAPGTHTVVLAAAEWESLRPGREVWGAAIDASGRESSPEVVHLLLAQLADGAWAESALEVHDAIDVHVERAQQALANRARREEARLSAEADALRASRRVILEQQHERRVQAIESRLATSRHRGNRGVALFMKQREAAMRSHAAVMADLDHVPGVDLALTALAVCLVEVTRES